MYQVQAYEKYHWQDSAQEALSEREVEVPAELVIAHRLHISILTVISHRKNNVEKTGIKSLPGPTIYANSKRSFRPTPSIPSLVIGIGSMKFCIFKRLQVLWRPPYLAVKLFDKIITGTMMKRISTTILLTMLAMFTSTAQETDTNRTIFNFEASYTGDLAANLSGGIKTGTAYLGMANIFLGVDLQSAGLLKGGEIFINGANTHGASPTEELFGDVQVVSNIEAGNHTYIQELWYKQSIGRFEFTAGLQDLNIEFAASEYGALFINSSFGIAPTLSQNFAAPIFPITALGITAKWNISFKSTWQAAVYEGTPVSFEDCPHNICWKFDEGEGILAVSELQHRLAFQSLQGIYKAGLFTYHDSTDSDVYGFYAVADQQIWKSRSRSMGLFSQVGYSPSENAFTDYYFSLGASYSGLLSKEGADILGLAVAHESFNKEMKSETAVELSYQHQLTDNIFIQPDIQYIINPAGGETSANHTLAGIMRFGITF